MHQNRNVRQALAFLREVSHQLREASDHLILQTRSLVAESRRCWTTLNVSFDRLENLLQNSIEKASSRHCPLRT